MKVKILRLGHSASHTDAPEGSTVSDVLSQAGVPFEGYSISINGLGAGLTAQLAEGDVVTLVPKVEGGSCGGGQPRPQP